MMHGNELYQRVANDLSSLSYAFYG